MSAVHHLPLELSSFVGRVPEFTEVTNALTRDRLVTLVGPGGCGKTRLAMRVSQLAAEAGEVWWVDLARETEDGQVARFLAERLGVYTASGVYPEAALARGLADRDLLLVLDNCEHVLAGVTELVAAVLAGSPGVRVLATSRTPLGVPGEQVWRVPPMSLGDALDLFLVRAAIRGADRAVVSPEMRAAAQRICDRLDRLPLALELAAGWAGTLSPGQIADALTDPLAMLDGGPRSAPVRQQSLEGSMRWSHDRLGPGQRALFRRLGAFRAGFTVETAIEVCGFDGLEPTQVIRTLRGLVDASLVVADTTGDVARYSMLHVIHAYAQSQLQESGEWETAHDRHRDAYVVIVEGLRPLRHTDKDTWRRHMSQEYANIRAAIDWGQSRTDTAPARRLAIETAWLWFLQGRGPEGLVVLRRAVEDAGDEQSIVQARLLLAVAIAGDPTQPGGEGMAAARAAERMATPFDDIETILLARFIRAIETVGTDVGAARELGTQVQQEARRHGHTFTADAAAVLVGATHLLHDDYAGGIAALGDAPQSLLSRGDRGAAATGLGILALAAARSGELDRANELARQGIEAAEPLLNVHRTGTALATFAEVSWLQGRLDAVAKTLIRVERLIEESGLTPYLRGRERLSALLELCSDNPAEAIVWCRREGTLLGITTDDQVPAETRLVLVAALRATGDEEVAIRLIDGLVQTTQAQPGTLATALELKAHTLASADAERAVATHHEALQVRSEHRLVIGCVDSLEALAGLAWRRGAAEYAAVLAGATERTRSEMGYRGRAIAADWRGDLAAVARDPQVAEAMARGAELPLTDAIAYATRMRGPRRRPDSGWESLTPTERSVADLAVEGLTNPEIAGRLFISRGTVKTHLAHVYAKLGVGGRTELARIASQPKP